MIPANSADKAIHKVHASLRDGDCSTSHINIVKQLFALSSDS
jgi:hypothetical protein